MIKAIEDRVFIKLKEAKETTLGGVILPENIHQSKNVGVVISKGEKVKAVKIGDKVLFHEFDELPTYDKDVVVVRENSILGVFEDE